MDATNTTIPWPSQVALDNASDRQVTCDDGRRLDLELYRDCTREQAEALRRQAIMERRAYTHAALCKAAASCAHWARRVFSAPHLAAGSSAGSRNIG